VAVLLFLWGIVAFQDAPAKPIRTSPIPGSNYSQWPGRAAEEVEQQITIPVEIQMNGIPHLQHVRSSSLAGLSVVNLSLMMIRTTTGIAEGTGTSGQVTLPANVSAQIGPDFSPIGSIYWYTLKSNNPAYDTMELKSCKTG